MIDYMMLVVGTAAASFAFGYYVRSKEPTPVEPMRVAPAPAEPTPVEFPLERAKELYAMGMGTPKVAAAIGWSQSSVYKHLKSAGVQLRPVGLPPKPKTKKPKKPKTLRAPFPLERAKQMYAEGTPGTVIAKELGYTPQYIYNRLKIAGVGMRRPYGAR